MSGAPVPKAKVAVVGPNGKLGKSVVTHLLADGVEMTLVSRDATQTRTNFPNQVKIVQSNYESSEALAPLFQGHDSVVSLINRQQHIPQMRVIDAAVQAKVPHIVPSAFGLDSSNAELRKVPIVQDKFEMLDHVFSLGERGLITYTAIETGLFLDWALRMGILVNFKGELPTIMMDGGRTRLSLSSLDDIGKAVAAAVRLRHDVARNKELFIQTAATTQDQLLQYAKELLPERPWNTVSADTAELESQAWELYNKGERGPEVLRGFMARSTFGSGLGLHPRIDNALLGIEEAGEDYVKEAVKQTILEFQGRS